MYCALQLNRNNSKDSSNNNNNNNNITTNGKKSDSSSSSSSSITSSSSNNNPSTSNSLNQSNSNNNNNNNISDNNQRPGSGFVSIGQQFKGTQQPPNLLSSPNIIVSADNVSHYLTLFVLRNIKKRRSYEWLLPSFFFAIYFCGR